MDITMIAQITGWAATLLAMSSYAFKNVKTLRIVNLTAASLFIAYGAMIVAPAIIIGNASIAFVHILHLVTKGRFARVQERHPGIVWGVFSVYAVAMVAWTCWQVWDGTLVWAEILGTVSAVGMVGAFLIADEKRMRAASMVFTFGNIVYSALIASAQMIVTNVVALGANFMRWWQVGKDSETSSRGAGSIAEGVAE